MGNASNGILTLFVKICFQQEQSYAYFLSCKKMHYFNKFIGITHKRALTSKELEHNSFSNFSRLKRKTYVHRWMWQIYSWKHFVFTSKLSENMYMIRNLWKELGYRADSNKKSKNYLYTQLISYWTAGAFNVNWTKIECQLIVNMSYISISLLQKLLKVLYQD